MPLVIDPRVPTLLALLAAALCAGAATLLFLPTYSWGRLSRSLRTVSRTNGLISGTIAGATLVLVAQTMALSGIRMLFMLTLALLVFVLIGVYLPGLESRAHTARRKRLQIQAIDFAGYMYLALNSSAGEVSVLREYVRCRRPSVRDMQQVIVQAIHEHQRAGRGSLWDRLHDAAGETGSDVLMDLTSTLREIVQQDRAQVQNAMAAQRTQLIEKTTATFTARAQRLEWVILGVTACSLFMGLLLFILFTMTSGLTILDLLTNT